MSVACPYMISQIIFYKKHYLSEKIHAKWLKKEFSLLNKVAVLKYRKDLIYFSINKEMIINNLINLVDDCEKVISYSK